MKFKSPLFTQTSGSIGGSTFSRNRGGLYIRARASPVNPNTPQQQVVRADFAQLASRWSGLLSQVQRDAWDLYALNVLLPDRLGEPRNAGGLGMYQRSNIPRLQAGLPRVDAAPTIFDLGDYTSPFFDAPSEAAQDLVINFDVVDSWVGEDDSAMLIFGSRGNNTSINYFKGPYRLAGPILGDAAIPPTSPATIASPFVFSDGQALFVRANVTRADGRLGNDIRLKLLPGP